MSMKAFPNKNSCFIGGYFRVALIAAAVIVVYMIHGYTFSEEVLNKSEELIRIKVIPNELSDAQLHVLPKESFSFACMIDAGSSGSRVHIYRYGKLGSLGGSLDILPNHVSLKEKPGLSSYAKTPSKASQSLVKLIEFMKVSQLNPNLVTT